MPPDAAKTPKTQDVGEADPKAVVFRQTVVDLRESAIVRVGSVEAEQLDF